MSSASVAHNMKDKPRTGDVLISENVDFEGLLLSDPVLKGLKSAGFERPSPIQLKAIPLGRCGLDLIVQAKSGTGKTCVFSVVALENLQLDSSALQAIVLAPTREIAIQIWDVINSIGKAITTLKCHTFIGGMPLQEDRQKLKKCHIAVGTPGRIKQLIESNIMSVDSVRMFILDEADKLLEESFQEQINWIYSTLPDNKQMLALSATYPEYLAQHLTAYMRNPTFLRLNITDPALLGIKQYFKTVPYYPLPTKLFEAKVEVVVNLLSSVNFQQCLIFSNLQTRAQNMADTLTSLGWPTACIAGSHDQKDRNEAMAKLKTYKCRVLISTDLTSRGIDADKVNMVINLDVPKDHETYLHRIGRAGRFGSFGAGITIISIGQEQTDLHSVEKKCNTHINPLPGVIPADLCKSEVQIHLDDVVSSEQLITDNSANQRLYKEKLNATDNSANQRLYKEKSNVTDNSPNQEHYENESKVKSETEYKVKGGKAVKEESDNINISLENGCVQNGLTKKENGDHCVLNGTDGIKNTKISTDMAIEYSAESQKYGGDSQDVEENSNSNAITDKKVNCTRFANSSESLMKNCTYEQDEKSEVGIGDIEKDISDLNIKTQKDYDRRKVNFRKDKGHGKSFESCREVSMSSTAPNKSKPVDHRGISTDSKESDSSSNGNGNAFPASGTGEKLNQKILCSRNNNLEFRGKTNSLETQIEIPTFEDAIGYKKLAHPHSYEKAVQEFHAAKNRVKDLPPDMKRKFSLPTVPKRNIDVLERKELLKKISVFLKHVGEAATEYSPSMSDGNICDKEIRNEKLEYHDVKENLNCSASINEENNILGEIQSNDGVNLSAEKEEQQEQRVFRKAFEMSQNSLSSKRNRNHNSVSTENSGVLDIKSDMGKNGEIDNDVTDRMVDSAEVEPGDALARKTKKHYRPFSLGVFCSNMRKQQETNESTVNSEQIEVDLTRLRKKVHRSESRTVSLSDSCSETEDVSDSDSITDNETENTVYENHIRDSQRVFENSYHPNNMNTSRSRTRQYLGYSDYPYAYPSMHWNHYGYQPWYPWQQYSVPPWYPYHNMYNIPPRSNAHLTRKLQQNLQIQSEYIQLMLHK